jgi:hypothetical protein
MEPDYTQSGLVHRFAHAAVQMQVYIEERVKSLGISGVSFKWQVEGGWESLPKKATLVTYSKGEPLHVEFLLAEIAAFPAQAEQGQGGRKLQEIVEYLSKSPA